MVCSAQQQRRRGLETSDDGAQPHGGRGEIAFHESVDGARRRADVAHRIAPPGTDRLDVEAFGAQHAVEHLGVDGLVGVELAGTQGFEPFLQLLECLEALGSRGRRPVFELGVVLVEASGGALGGLPGEVGVVIVVNEDRERAWIGGGQCAWGVGARDQEKRQAEQDGGKEMAMRHSAFSPEIEMSSTSFSGGSQNRAKRRPARFCEPRLLMFRLSGSCVRGLHRFTPRPIICRPFGAGLR